MIRTFKIDSTILPINNTDLIIEKDESSKMVDSKRRQLSLEDSTIRIAYSEQRFEHPKDLFCQPRNGALKKTKIPTRLERDGELMFLASGKVITKLVLFFINLIFDPQIHLGNLYYWHFT